MVSTPHSPTAAELDDRQHPPGDVADRAQRRYLSPEDWLRENPGTIGRTKLYELLQEGDRLPAVRLGRRYLVPSDLLNLLLAEQSNVSAA